MMNDTTIHERNEDMSCEGFLRIIKQPDGDVIVSVYGCDITEQFSITSVEFCAIGSGGGRSSHTLNALRALAEAIDKDNKEFPINIECGRE
jgi:hypothetical protein